MRTFFFRPVIIIVFYLNLLFSFYSEVDMDVTPNVYFQLPGTKHVLSPVELHLFFPLAKGFFLRFVMDSVRLRSYFKGSNRLCLIQYRLYSLG